jgi:hypothetical protein
MRLTKTLYIVETKQSDTPTGVDQFGRPTFETIVKTPFFAEVEPYSSGLAEQVYGVFVDVTNRVFCTPNSKIKIKSIIEYINDKFEVTLLMQFDNHYELLIKKVK